MMFDEERESGMPDRSKKFFDDHRAIGLLLNGMEIDDDDAPLPILIGLEEHDEGPVDRVRVHAERRKSENRYDLFERDSGRLDHPSSMV
jgi:hypothetical protein